STGAGRSVAAAARAGVRGVGVVVSGTFVALAASAAATDAGRFRVVPSVVPVASWCRRLFVDFIIHVFLRDLRCRRLLIVMSWSLWSEGFFVLARFRAGGAGPAGGLRPLGTLRPAGGLWLVCVFRRQCW